MWRLLRLPARGSKGAGTAPLLFVESGRVNFPACAGKFEASTKKLVPPKKSWQKFLVRSKIF